MYTICQHLGHACLPKRKLSPKASSMKESALRSEVTQVKAQLAGTQITIPNLKHGTAVDNGHIGATIASHKRGLNDPSITA